MNTGMGLASAISVIEFVWNEGLGSLTNYNPGQPPPGSCPPLVHDPGALDSEEATDEDDTMALLEATVDPRLQASVRHGWQWPLGSDRPVGEPNPCD